MAKDRLATDCLTLLACQITIPAMTAPADRDAHLFRTAQKVKAQLAAAPHPVDLVVLPELSSIDYDRATFERLDDLAEAPDGPSFQAWRSVATEYGVAVCYSFPRKSADGFLICCAVIGPDGELLGSYDKLHLAQYGASMEKDYFRRGDHLFVFGLNGFRLAPIICYDIRIPELSRTLTLEQGADVILHCGAYFRDESFSTWHPFAITRALENQIFLLSLNRAGRNYGKSLFCEPWHDESNPPLCFAETKEDFRCITLYRRTLESARENYSFLKDRHGCYNLPLTDHSK